MKDVWVISLGGSRIVPDNVDYVFLRKFKDLIDEHKDKRFVVVCGGGSSARRYISALKKLHKGEKIQSMEGIAVTRLHAGFMSRYFGKEANAKIPMNMKRVENLLEKNRVVFCGALRWREKNTSDGTAAKVAGFLKCPFINLTNVKGLYSSDPRRYKKAKFIPEISWRDFLKVVRKIKFAAGQHFVLDLVAAREIRSKKVVTYIVGSLGSLDAVLSSKDDPAGPDGKKKFGGTLISG